MNELLQQDASQVAYSSIVSIADAIRSLDAGFYSWSVVKLYYSLFYSLRAFLACDGVCYFFSFGKPFQVQASAGSLPHVITESSSHKAVMQLFENRYQNSVLLSQQISAMSPFAWMQWHRENVNYRLAKFSEPTANSVFKGLLQAKSTRQAIIAYFSRNDLSFDEDHAILAFPILALKELKKIRSDLFEEEDRSSLMGMILDKSGRISAFDAIIC